MGEIISWTHQMFYVSVYILIFYIYILIVYVYILFYLWRLSFVWLLSGKNFFIKRYDTIMTHSVVFPIWHYDIDDFSW